MRLISFSIAVILIAVCCLTSVAVPAQIAASSGRKAAPDFSLKDQKGSVIHLSDYKGKIVLVNFWATWCHGCKEEIPWYVEFAGKYRDRGFEVIGISMDESGWKAVTPYLAEHKLNYPIVIGDDGLAARFGGVDSMPVSLLIDREGRIADRHSGMVEKDGWEKEIQQLLGERR